MVQLKLLQLIVDLQEGKNSLIKMGFSFQFLLNQKSMFESSDCIHKLHQKSCPFFFFLVGFAGFVRRRASCVQVIRRIGGKKD